MRRFLSLLFVALIALPATAQQKKLTPDDYAQWQQIGATAVADDGSAFAYVVDTVDEDDFLVLHRLATGANDTLQYAYGPQFSADNRWFAFYIGVPKAEREQLEKQKKQPTPKVGLMNLQTAAVDTFTHVVSTTFAENSRWVVLRKQRPEESKIRGYDLVLLDLQTNTPHLYGNVAEFAFNETGTHLALLLDAHEKLGNGVHLLDLASGIPRVLETDRAAYTGLTWHEDGTALAFFKEKEEADYEEPTHHVLAFTNVATRPQRHVLDPAAIADFPADTRISEERELVWADDAQTLFFGIKPWTRNAEPDSTAKKDKDEKTPGVDVWHWQDPLVQPQQKVRASQDRRFTYLAAWHLNDNRFVRIADDPVRQVVLTGDQRHAIGYDPTPYQPAFRESWNDVYVINTRTGARNKILDRNLFVYPSPGGRYVLYFKGNDWWAYDLHARTHANLTEDLPARFDDYTDIDGREQPGSFGFSFWGEDDEWVLLNDRYDVWRVRPDGSGGEKLTDGAPTRVRHRVYRTVYDEDKEFLENADPIYLTLYGDRTKESGYAKLENGRLVPLIYEARSISNLRKAEAADVFLFTKEKADESPNVYATDARFRNPRPLTNTNPQQADYEWGRAELITFTNASGDTLQGRLLYPANYEPGKQYPMVVYIYELRSQTLHDYTMPTDRRAYNQRRFSADGFFVFEPDITYRLRDPGVSAVESVVPAVETVLATRMVNPDQVGLMGHSWGAYQTAFIVSQTDLFKAAVAGAPLTNMISMYGSMYWNSGTPDAVIFETSQGRFPDPYWIDWEKYVANSPVFHAENIHTPLLVAFGTEDGAVDFNQGVEMYNAMRRLEKPFVMLVYEGENHGLAKEENQRDYATRTHEWFRHFLLSEPAPAWIEQGMPWLDNPFRAVKK